MSANAQPRPPAPDRSGPIETGPAGAEGLAGGAPAAVPVPEVAPLAVWLEGRDALCLTDVRSEMRLQAVASDPGAWLRGAAAPRPQAPSLPFDETVLAQVRAAREAGRPVALLTTGPRALAEAVARETALFDLVVDGTDRDAALASLRASSGALPDIATSTAPSPDRRTALMKALRPHQWSKNALVFLPALAAHDPAAVLLALAAFVAFSLTASCAYVLNDLCDLAADRAHPRKNARPFASGALTIAEGGRLAAALLAVAAAVALAFTPPAFLGVLAAYFLATLAYSFWLKRKLVIDVIALASLYTLRIIAGAAATGVPLSPWMLGFSMFLFLALAAVKRQAELTDMLSAGDDARIGRGYVPDDLPVIRSMALAAGYSAVLVLALYISSEDVRRLYSMPEALWLLCPILLYWISRMVMNTHRGKMTDDPIVYATTDKVSLGIILAGALVIVAAALL